LHKVEAGHADCDADTDGGQQVLGPKLAAIIVFCAHDEASTRGCAKVLVVCPFMSTGSTLVCDDFFSS
jgi:hypothetical protein